MNLVPKLLVFVNDRKGGLKLSSFDLNRLKNTVCAQKLVPNMNPNSDDRFSVGEFLTFSALTLREVVHPIGLKVSAKVSGSPLQLSQRKQMAARKLLFGFAISVCSKKCSLLVFWQHLRPKNLRNVTLEPSSCYQRLIGREKLENGWRGKLPRRGVFLKKLDKNWAKIWKCVFSIKILHSKRISWIFPRRFHWGRARPLHGSVRKLTKFCNFSLLFTVFILYFLVFFWLSFDCIRSV